MGIDIEHDFTPRYSNLVTRKKVIDELVSYADESSAVLLATDPDREGEAISWHLAYILNVDPTSTCRITFNEITKNAVAEALESPRTIDMNMVDAQQARRVLDRIVGYKLSPLLWKKFVKASVQVVCNPLQFDLSVKESEKFKLSCHKNIGLLKAILKHLKRGFHSRIDSY